MRFVIVPAAAAFLLLAAAVTARAQAPDTDQAPAAADPAADTAASGDEELICQIQPPTVGSRIGSRKVCKTRAEWSRSERGSGAVTDNPGVNVHAGRGLPSEGGSRVPGN